MSKILPETNKSETPKAANVRKIGMVGTVLGALLLGGILYGVFRAMPNLGRASDIASLKVGQMATLDVLPKPPAQPVAIFQGPDGNDMQLSALKGKVVLVNLWATWCAPCVTEMPTLAKLQGEFDTKDFVVVAVSVDRQSDKVEAAQKLSELTGNVLPFYHDPRMAIVYPMQARGFPTSVLYGRDGKEVARLAGEADWHSPEARAVIKSALLGK